MNCVHFLKPGVEVDLMEKRRLLFEALKDIDGEVRFFVRDLGSAF